MAINWTPVKSGHVRSVGWDEEADEVLIEFKDGAVYAYANQGESVYQDLATSPSPGSYVARHLRNQPARRIS